MWSMIHRVFVPALLVLAGIASVIYGARFHRTTVVEEQETERSIQIDLPFLPFPPPPGFPGGPPSDNAPRPEGAPPGEEPPPLAGPSPFGPPPPFLTQVVKEVVQVSLDELEPKLVRDVTIGGLVLLESGKLMRTYSGTPPSLCPS
jgi:hypothetical protein